MWRETDGRTPPHPSSSSLPRLPPHSMPGHSCVPLFSALPVYFATPGQPCVVMPATVVPILWLPMYTSSHSVDHPQVPVLPVGFAPHYLTPNAGWCQNCAGVENGTAPRTTRPFLGDGGPFFATTCATHHRLHTRAPPPSWRVCMPAHYRALHTATWQKTPYHAIPACYLLHAPWLPTAWPHSRFPLPAFWLHTMLPRRAPDACRFVVGCHYASVLGLGTRTDARGPVRLRVVKDTTTLPLPRVPP